MSSPQLAPGTRSELLIGCGSNGVRRIAVEGRREWDSLTTLDVNSDHGPDVVHDLEVLPWPFEDNSFDEIHAYEVLEHLGRQGDWKSFFDIFSEIWRVLKPDGFLAATCPSWRSMWAWGDPSHTRVLTSGSLVFLSQAEYEKQVGVTPMSDFRFYYTADFDIVMAEEDQERFVFVLQAKKEEPLTPGGAAA